MATGSNVKSFAALDQSMREEHLCQECGIPYKTRSGLRRHNILKHSGKCPFQCCGKGFVERGKFEAHQRKHHNGEKLKCDNCGLVVLTKDSLKKHLKRKHSEQQHSFKCTTCHLDFLRKDELRDHERGTHSNEMRYRCEKCGKSYSWRASLSRHIKSCMKKNS